MFDFLKKKKPEFAELNLTCPRCLVTMKKIEKEGVMIDTCSKCGGIWLDEPEIEKIIGIIKFQKEGDDLEKAKNSTKKVKVEKWEKKKKPEKAQKHG